METGPTRYPGSPGSGQVAPSPYTSDRNHLQVYEGHRQPNLDQNHLPISRPPLYAESSLEASREPGGKRPSNAAGYGRRQPMPHSFTPKKQTDRFQPMSSQNAILPDSANPHAEYQFPTTPDIDRWLSEENTFQAHQDDFDWLEGNVDPGDFPPSDQQNINQNDRQGLVQNTIEGETKVSSNNERKSMGRKSHEGTHPYTDDRLIHGHAYDNPEPRQVQEVSNQRSETKKISKRQERIASIEGEVGIDGRTLKGNIRFSPNGSMQWQDGGDWKDAVWHKDIRAELIAETSHLGQYVHARARGKDPLDITSFHPEQMFWGPGRNHWALMPHKLLFRLECKGFPVPTYYVENMMHNGRVVLDGDNHPVKDYCNIPKTLASNADAYLLEAIGRMDTRITQIDFRARMPLTRLTGNGAKALGGLSTIGQRMRRFRVKNAIPPWKGRENSENFKDYVRKLLSPEGVLNNSTEELDGLTRVQEDEVFHLLKGQHLVRAGSRALTPGTRRERHEADEQRTARLRAAAGDTVSSQHVHPGHGQKRKNISLESSEDDDELKPYGSRIKRVRPNVPNRFEQLTDREARRGRLERIVQPPAATTVKRGLAAALQTDDDGRFHVRGISPFKAKLLQFPHNGEHFELDGSHRRRTHAPSTNPFHEHPSTLIGTDAAFYGITFDPFQHDNQLATADSISSTNFGNQFISEGNTIGNSQEVLPYLSAAFDRTKAGNVIEEQLVEEDFSLHESPKFDFEPNAATRRLRSIPNDSDEIANLGTHPTEEIPDIQDSGDFFQFELDGTTQISDYDNNKFDREATKTALQTAREQYSQLLQIDAPLINPGASFDEQLKFLQDDLASRWHDKNVPSLTRIQQQPGFECKIGPELKSAEEARTEQTKDDSLTIPDDFLKALDDLTKDSNFLESDFFL